MTSGPCVCKPIKVSVVGIGGGSESTCIPSIFSVLLLCLVHFSALSGALDILLSLLLCSQKVSARGLLVIVNATKSAPF